MAGVAPPILARKTPGKSQCLGAQSTKTLFWRGKAGMATVQKDNPGYKGVITRGDQKRVGGNGGGNQTAQPVVRGQTVNRRFPTPFANYAKGWYSLRCLRLLNG